MKVLYLSYDGALDPLGASQVVPYLLGLASRDVHLRLISFEKPRLWADAATREALRQRLGDAGIRWSPAIYHSRPRLFATAIDILRGAGLVRRALRQEADVVHCRGDVAMTMARLACPDRARLLYDMRGFFSAERTESGSWRRGGAIDHLVRRSERRNLARAAGLVVLTERAREILESSAKRLPPLRVIPTCADTEVFYPPEEGASPDFGLVYSGSLGTWYMTREMVEIARKAAQVISGRVLFLTNQPQAALAAGVDPGWAEVRSATPGDVPDWLRRCRALFFMIRATPAKRASCPTKLAEGLATGLPILCNAGIGDLDDVVEPEGVGVVIQSFSDDELGRALHKLAQLVEDPGTRQRCRNLAVEHYSLTRAVEAYLGLYREMESRRVACRA